MKRTLTGLLYLVIATFVSNAQVSFIGDSIVVTETDTLQLPFALDASKRLNREDIENKREGYYVTGLPEMTIDPIRGLSIGANAFLFNNRDRSDPFFYYTPYRARYALNFRAAQNGRIDGAVSVDVPFAFNTKWRLRGDFIYANDPNWQYFGIGRQTLNPLQYTDKRTGDRIDRARFSNYYHNLAMTQEINGQLFTNAHYNELDYTEFLTAVVGERTFFEGRMRLMFGYEILIIRINTYDNEVTPEAIHHETGEDVEAVQGETRLTRDFRAGQEDPNSPWARHNIGGYEGGRIGLLQTGLMWDTRDLEPDPSSGVFLEYAQEISAPWTLSEFSFTKHLMHGIFYKRLFPDKLGRTVLTGRMALGYIRGQNIPFTEVLDLWGASEEGGIPVLGGARALRGYREGRFAGMVTHLMNLELRSRFYQTNILNQHLAFYAVPFFDAGTIWDSFREIELSQYKGNPGLGLRIAWNQATILRFDYARSAEDSQFFFVFGHTF
ncbi:DUF5982 domain-containing protein [Cytophagaceae bacterium ABcell3]|nr:DUF5982 domain-containing protein [Cytophagaceae bacterium ABcell3]